MILGSTPGQRVPTAEVKLPGLGPVEVMEVTPIDYGGSLPAATAIAHKGATDDS
ncbi:MAG: hypothetical protein ACRC8Y_03615 [Chroococcales cyanobacterium]